MKTYVCTALFLIYAFVAGNSSQTQRGDRYAINRGGERRNTGCDLSHAVDAAFKVHTLVDYSQKLIFNTHKDINRLRNRLLLFLSDCCSEDAGPECSVSERIIWTDRICEDNISTSKNREAALCCEKENLERGLCFKNLQNMPPVQLPVIGRDFSYEEECLAFAENDHVLVESYIHGLARRLTTFPLQMLSRISYAYILLYATCCAQSGHLKGCFSPKKEEFLAEVKKEIENENRICTESKQGEVDSSVRAVIFYAKKKPSDSWERAVEFGGGYASFASNCCRPKFITSDCFQKQSDVLLDRFCTLPTIGPQKVCCLKRESEKLDCLAQLALEESSTIPYASLQFDRLCDLTRNSQVQVLSWSAYEYSRRHTDTSTDAILNNSSDIRKAVNHCCVQNDTFACFPGLSMYFK